MFGELQVRIYWQEPAIEDFPFGWGGVGVGNKLRPACLLAYAETAYYAQLYVLS